jgi:hypothetical protein
MSKGTSEIPQQIKGRLRGSSRLRTTLSDVRKTLNPSRYPALMAWLPRLRHNGRGVFSGQFPKDVTRLKKDWCLEPIPPEHEILWATELLKCHTPQIRVFIEKAGEYERRLLGQDFSEALAFLESTETDLGVSLWSIESRIALLQAAHGLERQKAYVNSIREARVSNGVAVVAFYVSQRSEPATNPLQFRLEMKDLAEKWDIPEDYRTYLLFRITDECNYSLETCAHVLRYEATSSIVDYYDSYVRLAQKAILGTGLSPAMRSGLEALGAAAFDHRISKILILDGTEGSAIPPLRPQQLAPFDHLVQGQWQPTITAAGSAAEADPLDVSIRFVAANANAETSTEKTEEGCLGNRIEKLCTLLVTKTDPTEDLQLESERLTAAFRLMSFSAQLGRFASDQLSSHPITSAPTALKAFLHNSYLDPRDLSWLPEPSLNRYAKALFDSYQLTPGLAAELWRADVGLTGFDLSSVETTHSLASDTALRIRIHRQLRSGQLDLALNSATALDQSQSQFSRRLAARSIAHCLLGLQRLDETIDFIAGRVMSDSALIPMLPINECAERLDKSTRKALAGKLSTPIVLDLFARYISDKFDNIRAYAYEDFLIANGMEKPSNLARVADRFDRKLLTYYLRRICTQEIMQVSSAFRGSQELEQERIAVCSLLRQLDEPNAKEYEAEITQITRNEAIRLGVRHVDQSRIFVDLAAIRRWAERNLRDGFGRYRALIQAGVDTGASAFHEALEDALAGEPVPQSILELPKNEANDLLTELVSRICLECMTNPEYGLDCYLSMRIRHGTLSGQLRGPLEEQKLITQREGFSQQYKPNEFWLQELSHLNSKGKQSLDTRLSQFSREYDSAIDSFAGEFIQVYSTEKQGGLFNEAIPRVLVGALATDVKSDTSFDDFVSMCFDVFWQCVELDLKVVRNKIDQELKPKINSLFVSLQTDLENPLADFRASELVRAVRIAQTGAQNALNQVNEWFRLRTPESAPSFELEEIIDIGLRCVEKIHPDFRPQISQETPLMPRFIDWTPLSDIFFILFENVQKHSGIVCPQIRIIASESEGHVRITVESQVGETVDVYEAQDRVRGIKRAILEGSYQQGMRSEGGTGLMKLRKIIGGRLKKPRHLDFGFRDSSWFFVELELPFHEIPA